MGNFLKKRKENLTSVDEKRSVQKGMSFYKPGTSIIPLSISSLDEIMRDDLGSLVTTSSCTRPSIFNSNESDEASSSKEVEEEVDDIITPQQMEYLYEQYKAMNPQNFEGIFMQFETLKVVKHLFDMWQTDLIYKFDNYHAYMKTDVNLIKKYSEYTKAGLESNIEQMFLKHSIKMIITYKMILDHLETSNANELIQQLAISHGLLGIRGADFKDMDIHLTKYLLQRNLINDESIISLVAFLSSISDETKKVLYERRNKARTSFISNMELVGRPNVTRDA
ncbi:uncharacterized protein LOC123683479 isoform X2 [Harmonia axyridis]|uniref:uncharacterized protein LOC123683479 isoform X2 n=1 Tax=Harmonia axyridis TaxID=115357 RepID=UPI001E27840A|nr:uncharacterized protein LOC123683479 isoform X2 [Harmonia axyridis]